MTVSAARGNDDKKCDNCDSLMELLRKMDQKMDLMTDRFNGMESLMKQENEKLRDQLKKSEKKYEDVCVKMQAMAVQINQLKQENLSRNLIIKGVPELETDNAHLKTMVGTIFAKLRFNFPMTYIDCYRIGKKKENTCRPIVVAVFNVGLKNVIVRDKRSMKLSCSNFSNDGVLWGSADQMIYIDEHLTKENHLLFMLSRKLKQYYFKFVWTRNGRVFVRFNEKTETILIDSVGKVNKLLMEAEAYEKSKGKESEVMAEDTPAEVLTERESDGNETDKYADLIENPPEGRQKRKHTSPSDHGNRPKRQAAKKK